MEIFETIAKILYEENLIQMMKNYASYSFSRSVTRHEHFARRDLLSLQHRRGEPG